VTFFPLRWICEPHRVSGKEANDLLLACPPEDRRRANYLKSGAVGQHLSPILDKADIRRSLPNLAL